MNFFFIVSSASRKGTPPIGQSPTYLQLAKSYNPTHRRNWWKAHLYICISFVSVVISLITLTYAVHSNILLLLLLFIYLLLQPSKASVVKWMFYSAIFNERTFALNCSSKFYWIIFVIVLRSLFQVLLHV